MINKDIIKGVIYNRGTHTVRGITKHTSLIAMVVVSDKPLLPENQQECVVMGAGHVSEELGTLIKYKCPYKFGDISDAIVDVSCMTPDVLTRLK